MWNSRARCGGSMLATGVVLMISALCDGQTTSESRTAEQAFAAGDYRDTLRLISQAMSGGRLSPEQRYPLLMLRGESLLRVGERLLAANTFTQAADLHSGVKETAIARATAILIRRSGNNVYRPASGGEPIDILAPESRGKAFAALFADTQTTVRPQVQAALRGNSLPPIINMLQPVFDMGAMEYLSSGSAEQSRQTLTELADHARMLMNQELRRVGARIHHLVDMNNSIFGDEWGFSQRGLQIPEQRELRDLTWQVRSIGQTAQDARTRSRELGFDGSAWEPIIADAFDLADWGDAVLGNNQR